MKIRDISNEKIVIEAPIGLMQRAGEKLKALKPGDVRAKRQNLVSSEINRVWKLVKQELGKELRSEYVPLEYFLQVMMQAGYLKSAEIVIRNAGIVTVPEDGEFEDAWLDESTLREEDFHDMAKQAYYRPGGQYERDRENQKRDRENQKQNNEPDKKEPDKKEPDKKADEENVLSSKEVQELIKQIITHASKKHPVEFSKRATANFKSKLGKKPEQNKPAAREPESKAPAKGGDINVSGGDIDPKPFKKAFQKAKSRVISKVPRKERDAVYDELQDIFRELYGEL